jgi:hypothetical protein
MNQLLGASMNIEELANIAESADSIENEIKSYCERSGSQITDCINQLSLYIAKNYADGVLEYEFCDSVMNLLYGHMTDDFVLKTCDNTLPEPAFSIYLAFDAGEYYHQGDDKSLDPVKKYTDPQIKEVLKNEKST